MKGGVATVILGVLIPCAIFAFSVLADGERNLGVLENIHGIPYPQENGSVLITEEMAHADLFLQEPVFAKQAKLMIRFNPGNTETITLGIREDEFWLSYRKYPLYKKGIDQPGVQTKEITIPLTAALQDTNRSVDLMFFADTTNKSVQWNIHAFHASLLTDMPTFVETKKYIKSIIIRERAL